MKWNIFLVLCLLFVGIGRGSAQDDDLTVNIKTQLDNKEYDNIIKENAAQVDGYPALAIYYVGRAYFMKGDDRGCIKMMNLAISKDDRLADAYYSKGVSQYYEGENEFALKNLEKAIALNSKSSEFYTAYGDIYYKTEVFAEALNAYTQALKLDNPPNRAYTMLGQTYFALKKNDKALEAFKNAKIKLPTGSESYNTALYNIGILEILAGNYTGGEAALLELVNKRPDDYRAITKLIQAYYGEKKYKDAEPYKEKLYTAYKAGALKTSIKMMYCFDQFKWKDKQIEAYEKFESPKESGDVKLLFYVVNSNDDIEYKIQTEYEPILLEQGSKTKYLLCKEQSEYHATYGFSYTGETDYETLKKDVIQILEGKAKPVAETGK